MGGKAALMIILGFSIIFLVIGFHFGSLSTKSVDNYLDYYNKSMAHSIAVSGANMAANELFLDKYWTSGYSNLSFQNGTVNVSISSIGEQKEITATGSYESYSSTVKVLLQPSNFAKFGNFYKTVTALPATGDTFNGPFHTQGTLYTWGTPVFWGKTTSKNGLVKLGTPPDPKFYGGYDSGVDIPLEFDTSGMRSSASSNGALFKDTTGAGNGINVRLYFNSNGTITSSFNINDGLNIWSPEVTVPLTNFAPNGMIYVEKGDTDTKGTVNGRATIVSSKKGASGYGNIYQVDDIVYNNNPLDDPSSTDMLGMVAEQNIRILYNDDTKHDNINTHASMFSLLGNIGPDDALVSNDGYLASWKILGGLIAATTRVTAHYNSYGPYEGYRFVHTYDERFQLTVPPSFPHTRNYEVISWYE